MFLVCRGCGKWFMLGKIFSDGYYTHSTDFDFEKKLNEFYDAHSFCVESAQVDPENQFEIAYEIANEKGIKEI